MRQRINPMDLVYLWVDGSHPRSLAYRRQHGVSSPFQVSNHDELLYSLRSVHLHAPWFRRIVVVSECGIVPAWASTFPAVEWVDQDTLLPPEAIPCFNNMVLEAYLHRLPGLSEPFLYMNDDYFFGQAVTPDLWVQPQWTFFRGRAPIPTQAKSAHEWLHMTVRTADLCQRRWGQQRPAYLQHTPYLISGQAMTAVLAAFPEVSRMAARRSKRHAEDVVPLLLMQEWVLHEMDQPARTMTVQKHTTPSYFFTNVQVPMHQAALQQVVAKKYHFITLNDSFGAHPGVTLAVQRCLEQLWPRIRAPEAGQDFASLARALAWVQTQATPTWLQLGARSTLPLDRAKALIPSSLQWDAVAIPADMPRGGRLQRATTVPVGIALLCLQPQTRLNTLHDLARVRLYQPLLPRRRDIGFGHVA